MPQPRKREWQYNETIPDLARELRVPYTRLYNALTELGLKKIESEADLNALAVKLQQGAIPFAGLVKIFGPQTTLSQLARMEPEEIVEKLSESAEAATEPSV